MTSVATRMSADASDTRKRFCGALRARLVNTATTTSTLPTTVPRMMMVTTSTMQMDATLECGGSGGDLGEEEVWLLSREEFAGNISGKSILVKRPYFGFTSKPLGENFKSDSKSDRSVV